MKPGAAIRNGNVEKLRQLWNLDAIGARNFVRKAQKQVNINDLAEAFQEDR